MVTAAAALLCRAAPSFAQVSLEVRGAAGVPVGDFAAANDIGPGGGIAVSVAVSEAVSLSLMTSFSRMTAEDRAFFFDGTGRPVSRDLSSWRYLARLRLGVLTERTWSVGATAAIGANTLHGGAGLGGGIRLRL